MGSGAITTLGDPAKGKSVRIKDLFFYKMKHGLINFIRYFY